MAESDESGAKELLSDFNEAKFQIFRLHNAWLSCNSFSQHGKLVEWKWVLDVIWRELTPDAHERFTKKDGTNEKFNKIAIFNEKIQKAKTNEALYPLLQQKEIFLRTLQDEVGKGSKRSSTEEDSIDG